MVFPFFLGAAFPLSLMKKSIPGITTVYYCEEMKIYFIAESLSGCFNKMGFVGVFAIALRHAFPGFHMAPNFINPEWLKPWW
jgi:hypothetical protein